SMARLPDLEIFAKEHGIKIGTIADLIEYRSRNESLVERIAARPLLTAQGAFEAQVFRDRTGGVHLALTKGNWQAHEEVLVRVHEPLSVLDLLETGPCSHSWPLADALSAIQQAPCGAALLLNCGEEAESLLTRFNGPHAQTPQTVMDLRTYGVGAQILRELGIHKMKLLGSPRRMPSMTGYGLEISGFVGRGS
ncbi:MAG TPA: bifunctional 3,4-dihydroxy-2-butanone-4-phosphate synthase/GTP cyclohydrolase II, partial [Burkholderiaceae bacterium]